MDKAFFIAVIIGILSRVIMINLDQRQYPTQPNMLLSQLVLAFVASSLGALLIPALIERSYTSITFLSLAAEQFRQVRENRRNTLQNLEDQQLVQRGSAFIEEIARTYEVRNYTAEQFRQVRENRRNTLQNLEDQQLVQRGSAFIEEIARTYEVRNYMCIITSFFTIGLYHILLAEFNIGHNISLIISSVSGLVLALILRNLLSRGKISDIADVVEVEISFVDESIMQIGELKGITNIGLESDRQRFLEKGIGIEIIPKDNSYKNAGILYEFQI